MNDKYRDAMRRNLNQGKRRKRRTGTPDQLGGEEREGMLRWLPAPIAAEYPEGLSEARKTDPFPVSCAHLAEGRSRVAIKSLRREELRRDWDVILERRQGAGEAKRAEFTEATYRNDLPEGSVCFVVRWCEHLYVGHASPPLR